MKLMHLLYHLCFRVKLSVPLLSYNRCIDKIYAFSLQHFFKPIKHFLGKRTKVRVKVGQSVEPSREGCDSPLSSAPIFSLADTQIALTLSNSKLS